MHEELLQIPNCCTHLHMILAYSTTVMTSGGFIERVAESKQELAYAAVSWPQTMLAPPL